LKARATAGGAVQTLLDELLLVWRQDLRWCQLAGGVGPDRVPQEVARLLQDVVEADEVSCHLEARHYPAERHGSAQGLDILGVDAAVDVRLEVHLGHRVERARADDHRQTLTLRAPQSGSTYDGTKELL
jgi:hypothetical protein